MKENKDGRNRFPDWFQHLKDKSNGEPHFRLQDLEEVLPEADWKRFEKWIDRQTVLVDDEGHCRVFAWDLRRWIDEGMDEKQGDSTWD